MLIPTEEGAKKATEELNAVQGVPFQLNDITPDHVWNALEALDDTKWRTRKRVFRPFHYLAWFLLSTWKSASNWKSRKYELRWLVEWLVDVSKRHHFWRGEWPDDFDFPGTGEEMLVNLWKDLASANRELVCFLERNYQLVSRSVEWLLGQYAVVSAWRVLVSTLGFLPALLRVVFGTPVLAGIIVGWLFVLQGDSVVKFVCTPFLRCNNVALWVSGIMMFLVPLVMSVLFILATAASRGVERPFWRVARVTSSLLLLSAIVGIAFVALCGNAWLTEMMEFRDERLTNAVNCGWRWNAARLVLLWSPMAVFVGIFAQLIWTGRAPMEPMV